MSTITINKYIMTFLSEHGSDEMVDEWYSDDNQTKLADDMINSQEKEIEFLKKNAVAQEIRIKDLETLVNKMVMYDVRTPDAVALKNILANCRPDLYNIIDESIDVPLHNRLIGKGMKRDRELNEYRQLLFKEDVICIVEAVKEDKRKILLAAAQEEEKTKEKVARQEKVMKEKAAYDENERKSIAAAAEKKKQQEENERKSLAAVQQLIENDHKEENKRKSLAAVHDPKRPMSAYIFFCAAHRKLVKSYLGDEATPTDITSELAVLWHDLKADKDEKCVEQMAGYQKQAQDDKARYTTEMESYVVTALAEKYGLDTKEAQQAILEVKRTKKAMLARVALLEETAKKEELELGNLKLISEPKMEDTEMQQLRVHEANALARAAEMRAEQAKLRGTQKTSARSRAGPSDPSTWSKEKAERISRLWCE